MDGENSTEYKKHSNIYNVLMGFILKASQLIFPLITFPYISRVLLPEGTGRASFADSVIQIFSMLAMLGIPLYGIKACARVRDNKQELATTIKELLTINTCSMIVSYILLFISIAIIDNFNREAALLSIMSLYIILTTFGVEWFYQAIEQYDYITLRSVLGKLVSIALMFIMVRDRGDVLQYGFVFVVGSVGSNIFNVIRLHKFVSFKNAGKCNYKRHIKPILILFAFSATTTIYNSMATVMTGFLSSVEQVGYYSTAAKIKSLLTGVITVASSVLLPRASYLLTQNKKDEFVELIKNTFNFNLLIALPIFVYFIIQAENVILILAGYSFLPSVPALQVVMPAVLFIGLTNVIGIQLFLPFNRENYVFISTLIGAVVDVILNLIFIPHYGALGAALSTMFAELSVLIVQFVFAKKLGIKLLDFAEILKIGLGTVLATVVTKCTSTHIANAWLDLILSAFAYGAVGILFLMITRESLVMTALKKIRGKI